MEDADSTASRLDSSPLLSHISRDAGNDAVAASVPTVSSYGTIGHKIDEAQPSEASPPIHIDRGTVNHGHPYGDVVVDTVLAKEKSGGRVSYRKLVRDNGNFRWYLMSYLVTHAGEWFTYVASISAIEQINSSNDTTSRTSISILVSLRLLPNALFSSIGGVLADSQDRRIMMLSLDVLGSLVALLFLLAYRLKSIAGLYVATALQMTVAAVYEPNRSAIVPMLVPDEGSLKTAITMSELAWSVMTSVGSSAGGFAAEYLGIPACFCIDGISYLVSALLIWKIGGTYVASGASDPAAATRDNEGKSSFSLSQFTRMYVEGFSYLRAKPWGIYVFLKFCAALVFGAADVLNVSFSERGDGVTEGSSGRLGVLFGFVGIGCFLGPVIVDRFTSMDRVESLERACAGSFLLVAIGCYGLSRGGGFASVCAFTSVRSAGSSIVWVQSSLLLQKFSSGGMLGRVLSIDYALATSSEAFSAMCAGLLQDDAGLTAEQVSFLMALVALGTMAIWVVYLGVVRV